MIRPIFQSRKHFWIDAYFPKTSILSLPAQLRIRRNVHIELSVFFQRKNIDVILFSDIDLADSCDPSIPAEWSLP